MNVTQSHISFLRKIYFKSRLPPGRAVVAASLAGLDIFHGFQQLQIVLLAPHLTTPLGLWLTSGPLSLACSQKELPRQHFLTNSVHMVEQKELKIVPYSNKNWFYIQRLKRS